MEKHTSNLFLKSMIALFKRFHLLIFFVCTVAFLSVAVILVNQILTGNPADDTYTPTLTTSTIDEATLNYIQSLHQSTAAPTPPIPGGRINPFAE